MIRDALSYTISRDLGAVVLAALLAGVFLTGALVLLVRFIAWGLA